MNVIPCVYSIRNLINNNCYIGSTGNYAQRKRRHRSDLHLGIHRSKHLQNAYDKYGIGNISFKPIIICEPFELLRYEQAIIDINKPIYNNLLIAGTCLGFKHSEETKKKISISKMGHSSSPHMKELLRSWATGRIVSEETRRKLSEAGRGRYYSEETRQKLRNKAIGRKATEETKRKMSEMRKGKPCKNRTKFKKGMTPWNKGKTKEGV